MENGEASPDSDTSSRTDSDGDSGSDGSARPVDNKDSIFSKLRLDDVGNSGLVAHYFASGLIFGAINGILNGLFVGYLNVPSYLFNVALNVSNLPFCFTFLFGMLSDSKPISGRRRKPYMFLGWAIVFASLLLMSCWPLPAPYYCFEEDGTFELEAPPCNPSAKDDYVEYVIFLGFIALGIVISSAAADSLLVEYAKEEPEETRGAAQAKMQFVAQGANFIAVLVLAFGFNGKMYTGSFDQRQQLTFPQLSWILTVPAGITLCLVCCFVREPNRAKKASLRVTLKSAFKLMSSKSFFFVAMYTFGSSSICAISTPATTWVGLQWAGTKMLQRQLASLLGVLATVAGIWLTKNYLLQADWRKLMAVTVMIVTVVDAIPQFLTVFDVVRDQYFYLGEPIADHIPRAARTLVRMLVANELADDSNAGLVSGLIATVEMLGMPVSTVLSNQVFGIFHPSLSMRENYIADTASFRRLVGWSFVLSYSFSLASLSLLPLLPAQKADAQQRQREWPSSLKWSCVTVTLLSFALAYSILVDVISLDPSMACMKFVGGEGC